MRDKEKQKEWHQRNYQEVIKLRRVQWLKENGPCVDCGSWENLEVDHVDRSTKTHHSVWTWREDRRLAELKKCVVRCYSCHKKKSIKELHEMDVWKAIRIAVPSGMAWCYVCKDFKPVDMFTKNKSKPNNRQSECITCRSNNRSKRKEIIEGVVHGETASLEN